MSVETLEERHAANVVGLALGRELWRYEDEPDGDDSIDYIDAVNDAYEMKAVTSQELKELRGRRRWFDSTALAMHWTVLIDAPTMASKFAPMPDFPDVDPDTVAHLAADGLLVVPKAEREAQWRERFSGQKIAIPQLGKKEARQLERSLLVLEQGGISNTRGAVPATPEERDALNTIRRLTMDAICMAHPPLNGPGIEIAVGVGYARVGDPDVLAFRTQEWLDSDLGLNLKLSLRQVKFARRHGVITFDGTRKS